MEKWLIDDSKSIDAKSPEFAVTNKTMMRGGQKSAPALAVRINDLIIHDTKKWFGSADIRVDTLLQHGPDSETDIFFHPNTYRFSGIKDNQRLPIEHPGQRIFYGYPNHFMDVSVFISRDTGDSDELSSILNSSLNSQDWQNAANSVLAITAAAPQAAAIVGAIGGAATIANVAYKLLKNITGNTIGLYRTSWLQHTDNFGIGRHPESGSYRQQDFSFWYEILIDRKTSKPKT